MWNALSAVGAAVGLVSGECDVNLPNAYPFSAPASNDEAVALAHGKHYDEFKRVIDSTEWSLVDFKDPEGGDLRLWVKTQEGTYHFLKATYSIEKATPEQFVALVASENVADRQKFGPNMEEATFFNKINDNTAMLYARYWAPPPTAGRDFVFLQGKKVHEDGTIEVWGCSIAKEDAYPENQTYSYVRGASFWGWRVRPIMDTILIEYMNVSDPRGWCPSWLFAYLKTQAANDLTNIRAILLGKECAAKKIELKELGVSDEELKEAEAARK